MDLVDALFYLGIDFTLVFVHGFVQVSEVSITFLNIKVLPVVSFAFLSYTRQRGIKKKQI